MVLCYDTFRFKLPGAVVIVFALSRCVNIGGNGSSGNDLVVLGSALAEHDRQSGVVQAWPGSEETPTNSGLVEVPKDKSLLRFKMFDDPVPDATTKGLLQVVVEYDDPGSFLIPFTHRLSDGRPDRIELKVESIELTKRESDNGRGYGHRDRWFHHHRWTHRNDDRLVFHPTGADATVSIEDGRHYLAVVRGLSLPAGEYAKLKITFNKDGRLYDEEYEYPLRIADREAVHARNFTIESGKITTIDLIPIKEHIPGHHRRGMEHSRRIGHVRGPWFRCHPRNVTFYGFLGLRYIGETVHEPVEKIFIKMKQLSVVGASNQVLNDQPAEFELLSLRDGSVGLMGNDAIPPGEYQYFELALDGQGSVNWGDQSAPLNIESDSNTSLRFMGPFDLRGGRITEVFLHFDPNTSVFLLPDRGWVLDPDVSTVSVISMTPEQDARIVDALGTSSSTVVSKAELMFEGIVNSTTPQAGPSGNGKLIYTDVAVSIQDRLRGTPGTNPFHFLMVGGTKNGLSLQVHGMPRFQEGERVLLFLKKYGDRFSTVEGEMGKISL